MKQLYRERTIAKLNNIEIDSYTSPYSKLRYGIMPSEEEITVIDDCHRVPSYLKDLTLITRKPCFRFWDMYGKSRTILEEDFVDYKIITTREIVPLGSVTMSQLMDELTSTEYMDLCIDYFKENV